MSVLALLTVLVPFAWARSASASSPVTYTYSVAVKGTVRSDVNEFAHSAAATLADPRGWSLGGSVHFAQVASGGDFTLWLAEPSTMTTFSSDCDPFYSCRVGRDVVINDDRWAGGSPYLAMSVPDYRTMVVNHEVGHWLGLGHPSCPGAGQPAYVMQQQSKGGDFLGPCTPNAWPRPEERQAVASALGVPVIDVPLRLGISATPSGNGYWVVQADGAVHAKGDAPDFGSMAGKPLNRPLVGMASTPTGGGYWLVGNDGGIFSFGDAPFFGSTGNIVLNSPIVGMSSTPTGRGYWFVAADGGVFSYGDARFFGSTGDTRLNSPIVGMASTPTGNGYWLVAADGGIFSFGDAAFYGSTGNIVLNSPIVGMASTPTGHGYWFVAADGGVFSYGDATFFGSLGDAGSDATIVGMDATPTGRGYWLLADDGRVFNFGDAASHGDAS
jgi:hypothetical protein